MLKLACLMVLGALLVAGCAAGAETRMHEDDEVSIPLHQVPAVVLGAAERAVPGIVVESVEREVENGVTVYDVEGESADGTEYEIEVTAAGEVLEV